MRVTNKPCSPFCFGVRRPTIVLPAALCVPELEASLRHVLAHEVAHLHQRDSRGHAVLSAALPLLYLHPLYWWLRAKAHLAAELVADDVAAARTDARSYADALIRVSERRAAQPALLGVASVRRSPSEFYRRMNMLLQREGRLSTECSPLRRRAQLVVVGSLVALTASVFGAPELPAQGKSEQRTIRQLRTERDRLRSEVRDLRDELRAIKRHLARSEPEAVVRPPVEAAEALEVLGTIEEPEEIVEVELVETEEMEVAYEEPEELVVEEPVLVDIVEPEVGETSVPLLASIPILGDQFSRPTREAPAAPQVEAAAAADSRYVVDLVTRGIDLRGEREIARHRLELAGRREDEDAGRVAAIQLGTTEAKYRAVRQMIDAELHATETELMSATTRYDSFRKGTLPRRQAKSRIVRLEARLQMLKAAR